MAVLRIQGFSGIIPVTGDRAIPDAFATESVNTWLYGGELRGLRPPEDLIACQTATRRVMRIPKRTMGGMGPGYPDVVPPPSYLGDSVWVQFADHDTDVVKGQLVEDQFERYYFCSPTMGPVFNTYANLVSGLPMMRLGVPIVDTAAPVVSPVGGSAPVESRAYVYTWANIYGEESVPSPASIVTAGNNNATWNISGILDPPGGVFSAPPGGVYSYAAYSMKHLYRTVTGESGQTTFYRVTPIEGIAIGTTTYADTISSTNVVNNLTLVSVSWDPPPVTLKGFIAMPSGFLIGFDGNDIYMSEAYHFHAWPPEYQFAVETPVVGLGVLDQTCTVCTQGYPTTITGSLPATCAFTKATTGEPCLSRGSIVSTPQGIIYASQNGLILIGYDGIQNVTEQIITRDEWIRHYAPQFLRAARYQNGYLALRMPPLPDSRSGFFLDTTDLKVALTELSDFESCVALNVDFWSGEVFFLESGMVKRWDPPTDELMPVQWKSKEFQYVFQENFACYAIHWDDARYSDFDWGTSVMPTTEKIRFKVYADRRKVYDQLVPKNGRPIRLPSGFKADVWQFEVLARVPVYSMHVASTMKELKVV